MNNKVSLLGHYGGDKTHCLSAWQSTSLEGEEINIDSLFENTVKLKNKLPEHLLRYLAKNQHLTPFEKSALHFQVRADIATHIHFIKHRIGVSINTESARYKELEDKWYIPEDWGIAIQKHLVKEIIPHGETWAEVLDAYTALGHALYHLACDELTIPLGRKRAKETARFFLPYNKQLDFDVMFNFRSFMHFQELRNTKEAQGEVQQIAQEMLNLVKGIEGNPFELSLKAFNLY